MIPSTIVRAITQRLARPRTPTLMRWVAGRAGAVRPARRGSVLVLILGAMAMLGVIIVTYAVVGQETRRTGAVTVRRDGIQDVTRTIGDYIAGVIADDVLATAVQTTDVNGDPILVREAWDYPFTDYAMRVDRTTLGNDEHAFNPVGTFSTTLSTSTREFRLSSDPWLASTEPIMYEPGTTPSNTDWRDKAATWAHISNLSPDGRFVNLFNLRSSFDAKSGTGAGEMSGNLTVWDDNGNVTNQTAWNATLDRNVPSHWDTLQLSAFRPAKDANYTPADFQYAHYQWADADGDGMFDSRWFELVDAGDPNNIVSLLPSDDRFRWFVAARVVDLSGLVNVNTATDLAVYRDSASNPAIYPLGFTPADVDLRRLLTLQDVYTVFGNNYGYEALRQGSAEDDYSGYNASAASQVGNLGYESLRNAMLPGVILPLDAERRSVYYRLYSAHGGSSGYTPGQGGNTPAFYAGPLFGNDDLLELLTFRGANNPSTTSFLESIVGGKDTSNQNFSPLRSNRGLLLERGGQDTDNDGLADPEDKIWSAVDVRKLLTTVSGARPLFSTLLPGDDPAELETSLRELNALDLRVNAVAALELAAGDGNSQARRELFFGYADALFPYAGVPNSQAWTEPAWTTAHYGYNPELALRTAAHLTANLIDSYDRDPISRRNEPRAHTLFLSQEGVSAYATAGGDDDGAALWFHGHGQTNGGTLFQLDASRLAPAAADPSADILNVYGIEAQPFITQVATFFFYTDTPQEQGGDDDGGDFDDMTEDEATIKGDIPEPGGTDNPDFLGQIVAFQITNPFDVEIRLTDNNLAHGDAVADDEYSSYYLTFGGQKFKLAHYDIASSQITAVALDPGETRVFIALNALEDPASSGTDPIDLLAQRFANADPSITRDDIVQLIREQFSIVTDGGLGTEVEPILLIPMDEDTGANQYGFTNLISDVVDENRSAGLWRVVRNAADPDDGQPNRFENDQLVDRISQPADAAANAHLDRRIPDGNTPIQNAITPQYDTGLSIAYWASLRRYANPAGMPVGNHALPAYCLEGRWTNGAFSNIKENDPGSPSAPNLDDFDLPAGAATLRELVDHLKTDGNELVKDLTVEPKDWSDDTIPLQPVTGREYSEICEPLYINNSEFKIDPDGTPDNGDEITAIRVADLLLPLIVGPCSGYKIGVTPLDAPERLTLGEAVAMALGYSAPPSATEPVFGAYWSFADPTASPTERGHLRIDDYAPYVDRNTNGTFDPNDDERLSPGIPLALNILNLFTTTDPQFGGMTRMTQGLININTAPRAVLRTLPLVTPNWPIPGIDDVDPSFAGLQIDIAATIEAYRDRIAVPDLYDRPVDYSDVAAFNPDDPATWDGREQSTLNPALRAQPGFASVGELLAITNDSTRTTGRVPVLMMGARVIDPNSIDFLGRRDANGSPRDRSANGAKGLSLVLYDHDNNQSTPPEGVDSIEDDFSERLIIGAGLSNIVSVRSDVYAVWFVVHGYQRSDVEGLRPEDPLVPTVAKRFLMVVDRSKVRTKGQKPDILLFKELPM